MKTFSYTCRERTGAIRQGSLKAVDRAAAYKLITDQGCTPVLFDEAAETGVRRRCIVVSGIVACLAAVVFVVFQAFSGGEAPTSTPVAPAPVVEANVPKPRPSVKPVVASVTEPAKPAPEKLRDPEPEPKPAAPRPSRPVAAAPVARTPPTIEPVAAVMPRDLPVVEEPEKPKRRIPESTTESLLAMLGRPGQPAPPLPFVDDGSTEADFERFLKTDLAILADDTPEIADQKQYMGWMQQYMLDAKEQGMRPGEFLRAMEELRREESQELSVTLNLYREVERTNPADAPKALRELNEVLAERGLPPMQPDRRSRR